MKKALVKFSIIGAFFFANFLFAFDIPYKPSGYINDFANVLSAETKSKLETDLDAFKASTTHEIVVAVIPNMNGRYIEEYAVQMFRDWVIGTKENNNGVLLLLSLEERKSRIEVGYGLEGALTDLESNQILTDMTPYLKSGDYDGAIEYGVGGIERATVGEIYAENKNSTASSFSPETFINIAFLFFFFVIPILAAILGRTKSWWLGGVIGFVLALALFIFLYKVIWVFLLTVFGFVFDYFVSKNFKQAKSTGSDPSWWAGGRHMGGGFGGYSGSSGSSFGGFGGGSSGGGGSSSSW